MAFARYVGIHHDLARLLLFAVAVAGTGLFTQPALGDDTALFSQGLVPPNVIWAIDNSSSMYNVPCTQFNPVSGVLPYNCLTAPSTTGGTNGDMYTTSVAGSTMCLSNYLQALDYSPSTTYPSSDPTFSGTGPIGTFNANLIYPIYLNGYTGSAYSEASAAAYCNNYYGATSGTSSVCEYGNSPAGGTETTSCTTSPVVTTCNGDSGCTTSGGTTSCKTTYSIPAGCYGPSGASGPNGPKISTPVTSREGNCDEYSRCVYALTTYGYFAEPSSHCEGSGDPMGICTSTTATCGTSGASSVGQSTCPNGWYCNGAGTCLPGNSAWSSNAGVATGNFLNLYPPKYVQERAVFKSMLQQNTTGILAQQRMGLTTFNVNEPGGHILQGQEPACTTANLCGNSSCNAPYLANRTTLSTLINDISFKAWTPSGEMVDSLACYLSDGNGPGSGTDQACGYMNAGGTWETAPTTTTPVCLSCQQNFMIFITDGIPDYDGPSGPTANNAGFSYPAGCTNPIPDYPATDVSFGHPVVPVAGYNCAYDPNHYLLPWETNYAYTHDLDPVTPGTQNLITYAVSFGLFDPNNPSNCSGVLQRAAVDGGGQCFPATNASSLTTALQNIFGKIVEQLETFSAPVVQPVRTAGNESSLLALFGTDQHGPLWIGHLYMLRLWDTLIDGTYPTGTPTTVENAYVVDENNALVTFDTFGNLLSRPYWDAALCLAGDIGQSRGPETGVDPYDLNVSGCYRYASETATAPRKIYTKINPATSGAPDPVTLANESNLQSLLGATDPNVGNKYISWIRGFDELDVLGRGTVNPPIERNLTNMGNVPGWWKLGDIFHSAPVFVSNPTEYSGMTPSYTNFMTANQLRDRVAIAGANDGMIHSFQAGTASVSGTNNVSYTYGTGAEEWAFIPNHQMTRVTGMLNCPDDPNSPCSSTAPHTYIVDETPGVRDVFTGTGSNEMTQANWLSTTAASGLAPFWSTVAITGDRDGGTRFTALDVTHPASPTFLWEFPQASQLGSGATQRANPPGLSWSSTYPHLPAIFPVIFLDGGGTPYRRWVAVLNGGFSRTQTAGQGIYMVDAHTGQLLWKYEYSATATGERAHMIYSFAAGVAGVPSINGQNMVGLVAVDTGGQVWYFDISAPGDTTAGLAQWTGQRMFTAAAATASGYAYPATPTDPNNVLQTSGYPYLPMFELPIISYDSSGEVWALVGTGDRDLMATLSLSYSSTLSLQSTLPGLLCNNVSPYASPKYFNRFYALKLTQANGQLALAASGTPNTENNLVDITLGGISSSDSPGVVGQTDALSPSDPNNYGWFLVLNPAEKVNNPAALTNGELLFTTYQPVSACSATSTQVQCGSPSGNGRLYDLNWLSGAPIRHYAGVTGPTFGTYNGQTIFGADASESLGSGLPSAPQPTAAISGGTMSTSLLTTTNTSSNPQVQTLSAGGSIGTRVFSLKISRLVHDALVGLGMNH